MKKINLLKQLFSIVVSVSLILSCQMEIVPEIIGKSTELTAYERYVEDFNSGRIDSSAFIQTLDGGSLYFSTYDKYYVGESRNYLTEGISICKLDKSNKLVWTYTFGAPDESIGIGKLIQTADGSILFIASKSKFENPGAEPVGVTSLVKLSENGELLWEKRIDGICGVTSIYQTDDEGFVIASAKQVITFYTYYEFCQCEIPSYDFDWQVTKTDKVGNFEWSMSSGELDEFEIPKNIIQTEDKGYIVTVGSIHIPNNSVYRNFVVKLDQFGNIIKSTELSPKFHLNISDVIKSNDGGYIIANICYNYNDNAELNLYKINNEGDIVWTKEHSALIDGGAADMRIMKLFNSGYFIIVKQIVAVKPPYEVAVLYKCSILKFNNSGDIIE